jgi:hypothetical protein
MNASAVARHYGSLTPEERFRLILAAGARGDEAEQDRLVNSARTATFSTSDHAPFARAFDDLATLVFIELLEEAARYHDALDNADEDRALIDAAEADEEAGDEAAEEPDAKAEAEPASPSAGRRPFWQRSRDLAKAAGYLLRTKAEGWKLFCERLNVPPFALWRLYPGLDRLQRALALAEQAAFDTEGFLRWLNAIWPTGKPERTAVPLTVEELAAAVEAMFRERVEW